MNNITSYNDIGLKFESETMWATQEQIANIFDKSISNISEHISNIYKEGELRQDETFREFRNVSNQPIKHYNLDVIIAVGYRAKSRNATQFRIWATNVLKQYITDGYVIDEKRLAHNPDKLNELAAKIRELRNNEKNIYQSVRDCFKIAAKDYNDKSQEEISEFYSLLQEKFHYAITGLTAQKLILDRANHTQQNMGIQSFEGNVPTLTEARTGKNFVMKDELYRMYLLSEQWLLHTESVALRNKRYTMKELHNKLDEYIKINEYPVWDGYKSQLKEEAQRHAEAEYELYVKLQKLKLSGVDVDLESFYNGEYDDIYKERDLEPKRLSTMYKKWLEKENNKLNINSSDEQKIIQSIQNDNLDFKDNNFEATLEKIVLSKKPT